jgi:hypothetical protein
VAVAAEVSAAGLEALAAVEVAAAEPDVIFNHGYKSQSKMLGIIYSPT